MRTRPAMAKTAQRQYVHDAKEKIHDQDLSFDGNSVATVWRQSPMPWQRISHAPQFWRVFSDVLTVEGLASGFECTVHQKFMQMAPPSDRLRELQRCRTGMRSLTALVCRTLQMLQDQSDRESTDLARVCRWTRERVRMGQRLRIHHSRRREWRREPDWESKHIRFFSLWARLRR